MASKSISSLLATLIWLGAGASRGLGAEAEPTRSVGASLAQGVKTVVATGGYIGAVGTGIAIGGGGLVAGAAVAYGLGVGALAIGQPLLVVPAVGAGFLVAGAGAELGTNTAVALCSAITEWRRGNTVKWRFADLRSFKGMVKSWSSGASRIPLAIF